MIKLKAEANIDVDEKRSCWITATAEVDPHEVDADVIVAGLCAAVTTQALAAYQQVVPRYAPGAAISGADEIAKQRGEGKEVAPTATFGDDDD